MARTGPDRRRGEPGRTAGTSASAASRGRVAPPGTVPRTLDVAVVVVLVEVVALVGLAGWWSVEVLAGHASALGVALFLVAFTLGVAGVLVGSVRALRRGRRWARGPVMTWQLLQGATAVAVLQGVATTADAALAAWLARLAIVLGGAVLVLMVTRPVVHFTTST